MEIQFFNNDVSFNLKEKKRLRLFIGSIFSRYKKQANAVTYIFCTDDYLLEINKQFLSHDYYTDIITFNLADDKSLPIEGEIYISIDRVKDNAIQTGNSFNAELRRVIFHGILHLCGLKDKTKSQQQEMRKAEDDLLSEYFF